MRLILFIILLILIVAIDEARSEVSRLEIINAMAWVESSCDPMAVGDKDQKDKSIGLLQVKLSTAKFIIKKNGLAIKIKRKDLLNPMVNIYIGNIYLEYLINETGDLIQALDAYNRGLKNVKSCPHKKNEKIYRSKHPYAFKVLSKINHKWCKFVPTNDDI